MTVAMTWDELAAGLAREPVVPSAPKPSTLQGYNVISWAAGGMTYWAVSDLNAKELAQLQSLL